MKILASDAVAAKRLSICRKCPRVVPETKIFGFIPIDRPWCTVCLCDMKAKTKLANKKCPLKPPKWDRLKT